MDKHEREMQRTCHGVAVQRTDLEEACKEKTSPLISLRPQGDIERNVYLQTLTRGAWDHFHQHAPTKSNAALEEFIETCAGIPTSLDDFRAEDFPNVSNYFERIAQAREG